MAAAGRTSASAAACGKRERQRQQEPQSEKRSDGIRTHNVFGSGLRPILSTEYNTSTGEPVFQGHGCFAELASSEGAAGCTCDSVVWPSAASGRLASRAP